MELGLWLHGNKNLLENQEFVKKIIEEYNSNLNENSIFEWVHQLSDEKIKAVVMALELEHDERNKQT